MVLMARWRGGFCQADKNPFILTPESDIARTKSRYSRVRTFGQNSARNYMLFECGMFFLNQENKKSADLWKTGIHVIN